MKSVILWGWAGLALCICVSSIRAAEPPAPVLLRGSDSVQAVFAHTGRGYQWVAYRDAKQNLEWPIAGPRMSFSLKAGAVTNLAQAGFEHLAAGESRVVLESALPELALDVRQTFSFCQDGRTLRIQSSLRSRGNPVLLEQVGLLELEIPNQHFRLTAPEFVSSPVFGNGLFAGIEHPSALCRAKDNAFWLAQHPHLSISNQWTELPAAVFGACSAADRELPGDEALRRAFLRYLDTVRVKPSDMHVHYNDWWTAPVPSSERFVLQNIAALKAGLYDRTSFFFDSYALDAGWSDPKSAWEMDTHQFPQRFAPIRTALESIGSHVGLWISPSSLYPFALDNNWLTSAGYEVTPASGLGLNACLAKGGKYQVAFKNAALSHAREARLAHMKFDGFVARCDVPTHGHPTGLDSCQPIAEGLMEVFDQLRAWSPAMALEPTCFGYQPSPWWLMHVPFIIGPFGDDSPYGRCPAPDYLESMTTARELKNLQGRNSFLMPSDSLQCFDIIMQCPGAFQNHAAMAVGRGRWFISSYINPNFMDAEAWRFFADLVKWARHNREFLREPVPFGGDPAKRQPYGYAFLGSSRQVYCLRNPWIEQTNLSLLKPFASASNLEVRRLYPRRELIARLAPGATLPILPLGPYETQFIEVVPTTRKATAAKPAPEPKVHWHPTSPPELARLVYRFDSIPAFGPSWTSPDGDVKERLLLTFQGRLQLRNTTSNQLCVLCEGKPAVAQNSCRILVDDKEVPVTRSTSEGAFGAAGEGQKEHWAWFLANLPAGEHNVRVELEGPELDVPVAIYARGDAPAPKTAAPVDKTPSFPLYRPERVPWSRTLVPPTRTVMSTPVTRGTVRKRVSINGVFLDAMEWTEATAGWGKIQRNHSIMEKTMTLAGKPFFRGIGAHAVSRVCYSLPPGYATFAATIGKDQEVSGGSVVFAVQLDGREVFRSGVFRNDTPPRDISLPLAGAKQLTLLVEDAGDDISADHADWADARLLK